MDYPVLVNPGKPSYARLHREGHEEENQGGRLREPQNAVKRPRRCEKPRRAGSASPKAQLRRRASDPKSTIRRLKTQLARALARIEELQASADTDFLLDIPNRRGFERELHRAIAFIKRYHASGALIVLDVDRLKPINDAFGHAAGDQVLKAIVKTLLAHVRSSDVVGRLGGDEFALLLWNLSETDARAKAALLEETIDRLTFVFRWPHHHRGRLRRCRDPRSACGIGPRAGRGRQRDVCAQGAAAA